MAEKKPSIKKMTKEDLELLSNKDITELLLEEKGNQTTADLYKKIISLLELPESTFDKKVGDYFTALSNDKRFILQADGSWDLKSRHVQEKVIIEDDDEEELLDEEELEEVDEESQNETESVYDEDEDTGEDDLKDLVILDEDELDIEH